MAQNANLKVVTDSLVFHYDMNNIKSYKGPVATNLLPGGTANSYPTTANGWGTYNTNQYGSGTYFSIGTVSGVSGNIVTMSAAHSLRTYDVIQPQTTGGGVTAGTNYMVQKLSSTTFSLHAYNSNQSGADGFNTQNSVLFNQQVAINATSFPTMWWGYPHLPNSGLVKEIIPNGFNFKGRVHDCIRLHYPRADGLDGMAYGVDTTVTPSTAHTVSFYAKAANAAAVGQSISYQIYNYTGGSAAGYSFSFTLTANWQKCYMTFTPAYGTCISYWFSNTSAAYSWDMSEIMFNVGSVPLEYTDSSRASTAVLLDLTGKNTITASSLTYASNGAFSFNGSSDTMDCGNSAALAALTGTSNVTVEAWVNLSGYGSTSGYGVITHKGYPWAFLMENPSNTMRIRFYLSVSGDVACSDSSTHSLNTWYHFVGTYDGANMRFYRNGVLTNTVAATGTLGGSGANMVVGSYSGAYFSQGQIPVIRVYSKTLSGGEILQNFNAQRGRYGI